MYYPTFFNVIDLCFNKLKIHKQFSKAKQRLIKSLYCAISSMYIQIFRQHIMKQLDY
jgi:hypothetical protein